MGYGRQVKLPRVFNARLLCLCSDWQHVPWTHRIVLFVLFLCVPCPICCYRELFESLALPPTLRCQCSLRCVSRAWSTDAIKRLKAKTKNSDTQYHTDVMLFRGSKLRFWKYLQYISDGLACGPKRNITCWRVYPNIT